MPFAALAKLGFNPKLAVVDNRFSNPRDLAGKPTPPPPTSFVYQHQHLVDYRVDLTLFIVRNQYRSQRAQLPDVDSDDLRPTRRHRSPALEVPVYEPVGRCFASRRLGIRIVRKW